MNTTEHTLPTNFHLIVIPDNLEHWNIPEVIDKIERIETVYLFDKRVHVHCCEITPSYELWPIETRAILKDEFAEDEALRDEVFELTTRWGDTDIKYVHVHTVDSRMAEEKWEFKDLGIGDVSYDDVSYDDQRDSTIEHCQSNCQI